MQKDRLLTGIGGFVGLIILILDSRTALTGARDGLQLCVQTVIPSLFPFFVLSIMLTGAFVGSSMPFFRPFGRLFRIPAGAESILVAAFLGGYPVGAQTITLTYRNGQLSREDAERMLGFCNNAGPSFLFGMSAFLFPDRKTVWILWGILILSALLVARLLPGTPGTAVIHTKESAPLSAHLFTSVKTMGNVCGWVILFRVLIAFFQRWFLWLFPMEAQVALIGLLELSNGCVALTAMENTNLRFLICGCILAFGGVCVTMQTFSVTEGLSRKTYLYGKILQTIFTLLFSLCTIYGLWYIPAACLCFSMIPEKNKKSGSIPRKAIV